MAIQHVEDSLNKIRSIFVKASDRIEAMKPGDKIPATKLSEDLAKEIGMTGPQLYPTLKFLLDGYPDVKILKGAHGGIMKLAPGVAPVVVPASSPAPSQDDSTQLDEDDPVAIAAEKKVQPIVNT